MSKHFRVPGRLPAKLRESGIRMSAVLQSARLPPELLDQPRVLVTTEELFAFWRGVGEVSSDPAIGLELGTEAKPALQDLGGYHLLHWSHDNMSYWAVSDVASADLRDFSSLINQARRNSR